MRYTERHCGVAVIKDKSKDKEAMERLARFEECAGMQEMICDHYCRFREECGNVDEFSDACELETLLELLEEVEE